MQLRLAMLHTVAVLTLAASHVTEHQLLLTGATVLLLLRLFLDLNGRRNFRRWG